MMHSLYLLMAFVGCYCATLPAASAWTVGSLPVSTISSHRMTRRAVVAPHQLAMTPPAANEESTDSPNEEEPEAASAETEDADDTVSELTASDEADAQADTEAQAQAALEALKADIAAWDADVKRMRRRVADVSDQAEEYTQSGYARKVAEMENMRRARTMLQSSNKFASTANVLQEFVPIWDTLIDLRLRYGDDAFGSQYNALPGAIKTGFANMACTDIVVEPNAVVDAARMTVLATEPSETVPVAHVIRLVAPGLELHGNVIRPASVVTSAGTVESAAAERAEALETE